MYIYRTVLYKTRSTRFSTLKIRIAIFAHRYYLQPERVDRGLHISHQSFLLKRKEWRSKLPYQSRTKRILVISQKRKFSLLLSIIFGCTCTVKIHVSRNITDNNVHTPISERITWKSCVPGIYFKRARNCYFALVALFLFFTNLSRIFWTRIRFARFLL